MPKGAVSPSAIKEFKQCPRKYHECRVLKLHPFEQTEEAKWGDYVHKCMEDAIMLGEALPDNVSQYRPLVAAVRLAQQNGWQVWCEIDMGVRPDGSALGWERSIWWDQSFLIGGKADLIMVKDDEARVFDWKTGSSKYPDQKQVDLYALGVMALFPNVQRVLSVLMFLKDDYKMVQRRYTRADIAPLLTEWAMEVDKIKRAEQANHWPEGEYTPLCGWCPCSECPNWQIGQDARARKKKRR